MTTFKRVLITSLATVVLGASLSGATLKWGANRPGNYTFAQGTSDLVPLANAPDLPILTELVFNTSGRVGITYSAECAVSAAAGNDATWLDIDLEILASNGVLHVLPPTAGTSDAFCTSNGTAGADGWTRTSVTVLSPVLPVGNHRLRVRAKIQNGVAGNSGWLGDSAVLIAK